MPQLRLKQKGLSGTRVTRGFSLAGPVEGSTIFTKEVPLLISTSLSCLNKWFHKNLEEFNTSLFGLQDLPYVYFS